MQLSYGVMLFFQGLYAGQQRVSDVLFSFVLVLCFGVVNRALHLADCGDEAPGLFCKVMFFFCDLIELVV